MGAPGSLKSPALAEALRPLRRLIIDAQAQYEEHRLAQQVRVAEQKARRHELARRLREAIAGEVPTEPLPEPEEAARRNPPPAEHRYLVNDTTVEKLGELLNHHPNGLLLFRDELSGFLHTMDRPGHENDRAFYCEAWNGTGAYTYDRIGRGRCTFGPRASPCWGASSWARSRATCGRCLPGAGMTGYSSASSWRCGPTAAGHGGTWTAGRTRRRGRA